MPVTRPRIAYLTDLANQPGALPDVDRRVLGALFADDALQIGDLARVVKSGRGQVRASLNRLAAGDHVGALPATPAHALRAHRWLDLSDAQEGAVVPYGQSRMPGRAATRTGD